MKNYKTLTLNIYLHLIVIHLQVKYSIKIKGKELVNICHVFLFVDAFDLDKNIETLATNVELKLVT